MKPSPKIMPAAAAFTTLPTLACCLPLSLSAAVGIATLSVVLEPYRGWLIGINIFENLLTVKRRLSKRLTSI
jgi:hypothetical protein